MSHVPHDLAEALGLEPAALSAATAADAHAARLADEYRALNRDIHRAETDVEPTSDDHLHEMKKRRLAILDALRGLVVA